MAYLLSEENIKHATLSFLKTYYKNNSSRGFGDTIATLDMKTGDGIIADGYLKFSVNDDPIAGMSAKDAEKAVLAGAATPKGNQSFLATFEATSQGTAEEIQYSVQKTLIFFDALAVASMVAAGSYGYNYMNDQFTLNQLGTFKFFAGFFGVLLASAIAYILIFRKLLTRYRYIYALAQFKRYHANEQWVSFGEDVFANPDNKYLLELKKQCIRQGFGLISVDQELQPSLVITPGRDVQKKKRKMRTFVTQKMSSTRGGKWKEKFNKATQHKSLSWLKKIKLPSFGKLKLPSFGKLKSINFNSKIDTEDYSRFTKSYWKQVCVICAMLFVMGEIYLEELRNPNLVYMDESKYENIVLAETKNNRPESKDFVERFGEEEEENKKVKKAVVASKKPAKSKAIAKKPVPVQVNTNQLNAFIISNGLGELISYGCDRLSGIKGNHFLVQIDKAKSSTEAIRKVKTFNENGYNCNALWLGCFQNINKDYIIYLDDIFESKDIAAQRATEFQKLQLEKGFKKIELPIRMISGRGK